MSQDVGFSFLVIAELLDNDFIEQFPTVTNTSWIDENKCP